jgi:hypothetical protein
LATTSFDWADFNPTSFGLNLAIVPVAVCPASKLAANGRRSCFGPVKTVAAIFATGLATRRTARVIDLNNPTE